jgi:hypothetical protein
MSINVGYYFNSDKSLNELTKEINSWLGSNLVPCEGDEEDLFCIFLGMELSIGTHDLENDGELNFEDYKYEIDIRTSMGNAVMRDIQISTVAFIAKVLYNRAKLTGMLVYDVQRTLARYVEKLNPEWNENDLFDSVSNKFVKFPQHSVDLHNLFLD